MKGVSEGKTVFERKLLKAPKNIIKLITKNS